MTDLSKENLRELIRELLWPLKKTLQPTGSLLKGDHTKEVTVQVVFGNPIKGFSQTGGGRRPRKRGEVDLERSRKSLGETKSPETFGIIHRFRQQMRKGDRRPSKTPSTQSF